MPKKKQCRTAEEDSAAFIAAALEVDCDESQEAFMETIKTLAKAKPMSNLVVKRKGKKKPKPYD